MDQRPPSDILTDFYVTDSQSYSVMHMRPSTLYLSGLSISMCNIAQLGRVSAGVQVRVEWDAEDAICGVCGDDEQAEG